MKNTLISIILFLFLLPAAAGADQNDARLDGLFKTFQETDDLLELRNAELEIWKIWTDSGRDDINTMMDEGVEAMQARNYDTALKKFDEIVELAPDFAEGWNKRATVYYLMHQLNESMQDVQRTLKLEPRHFGALSGIGLIFMEIGDETGALQAFEEVLKVNPHSPGTLENIRRLRSGMRDNMI
jgi:tetratricopeptide (TPR) repeat protein